MCSSLFSRSFRIVLFLVLSGCFCRTVCAQDLEPRAYANLPVGMNFAALGYIYTGGGVALDPSLPVENGDVDVHMILAGYARSLDVGGFNGKIDVGVPYGSLSGTAMLGGQVQTRDVRGFGDPTIRFTFGFLGSPALSLKEFTAHRPEWTGGVSLRVGVPLGQYDADKAVNLGTNRWSFKPEVGFARTVGRWTFELAVGVSLFTTNTDFYGGVDREQDPLYSVQAHIIYGLGRGAWVGLDATYYTGGSTTVDGVAFDDRQSNSRVGATLAVPISKYQSIKLYGSVGATVRTGTKFETVGLVWQYRWGAGL